MNLLYIDKEFNNLQLKDQIITHNYEPKIRIKGLPRHTYYSDLKKDFVNEINVFKFSPYIQMNYTQQQKNEEIRKHVNITNENNFLRFVKLTNVNKEVSVVADKNENEKKTNRENKNKNIDKFNKFNEFNSLNRDRDRSGKFNCCNNGTRILSKNNSMIMKMKMNSTIKDNKNNQISKNSNTNNNTYSNKSLLKGNLVNSVSLINPVRSTTNKHEFKSKKYYLMANKSKNIQLASLTSTNKQKKEAEKQSQSDSQNKNNKSRELGVYEEKLVVKRIREELDVLKAKLKSKAFVNLRKINLESLDEV